VQNAKKLGIFEGSPGSPRSLDRSAHCAHLREWRFLMPGKKHGPSIKKPKTYEALKKKGMSKSRAARISNAQADKQKSKKS
jgi:hypothetical protein